jgi:hypothetical protein
MAQDPQWAVRLLKRALKAVAALVLLLVVLGTVWLLLPEGPAETELRISTNAQASLAGRDLGSGEILLDDSALRAGGTIVPAGRDLAEIAASLFPGEEFRGPFMVEVHSMPRHTAGFECYLSRGEDWRVARVWIFRIEDAHWLAVPIEFRDSKGRVHTNCTASEVSMGWAIARSLVKRRTHTVRATVVATDGGFPAEDEYRIGPIEIR